jgi:hypothetical protein
MAASLVEAPRVCAIGCASRGPRDHTGAEPGRWCKAGWVIYKGSMEDPPLRSIDPSLPHDAMARRLHRRSVVTGQVTLPAVPGMIDEYVRM